MRIRTQLVLASFLLSVLPLSGIVTYSYLSSRRALEAAYQNEAKRVAEQMDRRLSGIRNDLEQRLAEFSGLQTAAPGETPDVRNVLLTMGEAASLIDAIEIKPVAKTLAKVAPKPVAKPAAKPTLVAAAAEPPDVDVDMDHDDAGDNDPDPNEDRDEDGDEPVLIDLPPAPALPRFDMTQQQRQLITEISTLGSRLGTEWGKLSVEERQRLESRIKETQTALDASLKASRQRWERDFAAARTAQMEQKRVRDEQRHARMAQRARQRADEALAAKKQPIGVPKGTVFVGSTEMAPEAPKVAAAAAAAAAADAADVASEAASQEEANEPNGPAIMKRKITAGEREELRSRAKEITLLFGKKFDTAVRKEGNVVAHVSAKISTEEAIDRILGAASDDRSEIAFAIDREGNVYTRSASDRQKLNDLKIPQKIARNESLRNIPNWIVVITRDVESGMRVGVARPVGENFNELRKTAAKNFGYGIALVFVALIGIVPLANHMTRDVNLVTRGAERVAQGDLMTRLPVKSDNEFGQLAAAFNRMAEDLSLHQQKIVQQQVHQRLLEVENDRKSDDLEDARRFQLSLLPKEVPKLPGYDIAVFTRTATEVGGDYYDFHVDGTLSVTVGDATGHGAKAGTMVTVIKTLFAGYTATTPPAAFLRDAAEKVKRMDLGRMAMALLVSRFDKDRFTVASAGMPPVYVHRTASGEIEEVARGATPLGTLGADYADVSAPLHQGDTVFLMTDGFPELLNATGQQLGYSGAVDELRAAAGATTANGAIAHLTAAVERWHGNQPPNDDVTFVVVRMKGTAA
jgi:serine phosphatase RsbU (regulator of sigma subunit)